MAIARRDRDAAPIEAALEDVARLEALNPDHPDIARIRDRTADVLRDFLDAPSPG